ncbi:MULTISPECIES: capsid protein [Bacteria]|uniref:Capsid protein n=2 Tax=Pseudomonadati TaxID=3379134 RepID=A0A7K0GN07_PARDI|nr:MULTISPECIES: capsid protein [Bacteria]MTN76950.1 capsid protein [Turicibacter sanguinis]KAB5270098.1 capsid protein [Bacteroides stercoris]KAB5324043.1 capsid protein [Bacteroides stercoris]MRY60422.1 capsid protein [Parabacteroides distasonis]MRY69680.1 capsid protein [Parabacteroides distasonis]
MDFQERLGDVIDDVIQSESLGIPLFNDLNNEEESISLYSLPGGKVIKSYYDGVKEKRLNYEIQGKSKDRERIFTIVSKLSNVLEDLDKVESLDKSFEFSSLTIASEPHYQNSDMSGFFYFRLTFQVELTVYRQKGN